MSVKLISH